MEFPDVELGGSALSKQGPEMSGPDVREMSGGELAEVVERAVYNGTLKALREYYAMLTERPEYPLRDMHAGEAIDLVGQVGDRETIRRWLELERAEQEPRQGLIDALKVRLHELGR